MVTKLSALLPRSVPFQGPARPLEGVKEESRGTTWHLHFWLFDLVVLAFQGWAPIEVCVYEREREMGAGERGGEGGRCREGGSFGVGEMRTPWWQIKWRQDNFFFFTKLSGITWYEIMIIGRKTLEASCVKPSVNRNIHHSGVLLSLTNTLTELSVEIKWHTSLWAMAP